MSSAETDVAVVGLGAWGAAALWRLATEGVDVVGVEQYTPGHPHGSSHGGSRMFRTACLEHPGLVPLARRSGELWSELSRVSGRRLVEPTGGLLVGPAGGHVVTGTLAAAKRFDLPVETLDAARIRARYPGHETVPDGHVAVLERTAALVRPEETIRAAVDTATSRGARVLTGTAVHEIVLDDDGVLVRLAGHDLRARQVVVTAGPWLAELVPGLPAVAVRMPMTWFAPSDPDRFSLDRFPVFIRELDSGVAVWGHGLGADLGPVGEVKLGLEDGGSAFAEVQASGVDRSVGEADWRTLTALLPGAVPGLGAAPTRAAVCMITRTPDGQFLLGRPGRDPRLVVGGGCSGHGFKHALGIGEVLADTVLGREPRHDLGFTDPNRFG
ncbi:N-methyl-L-tryptophan oxidase [Pseudonocardia sp. NPDC049635]|uniref:N-methyl-L-tryptophan oxidase n=1 Tax=Pseudonocardia sp. NPDC049635 TaxID=3155506 RepID=UPI0033D0B03F